MNTTGSPQHAIDDRHDHVPQPYPDSTGQHGLATPPGLPPISHFEKGLNNIRAVSILLTLSKLNSWTAALNILRFLASAIVTRSRQPRSFATASE
jgi:hypothetical protein